MIRWFWTSELLLPDSIVKYVSQCSRPRWNTLDYGLLLAPPSPSQPSSLLRNTAWSPLPFDLCVCCETPPAPFGVSSTTNERSQRCLSNLPAPKLNDYTIPNRHFAEIGLLGYYPPLRGLLPIQSRALERRVKFLQKICELTLRGVNRRLATSSTTIIYLFRNEATNLQIIV